MQVLEKSVNNRQQKSIYSNWLGRADIVARIGNSQYYCDIRTTMQENHRGSS